MRTKLLFTMALTAALVLLPGTASAHVLKVDGDIGAVLHINPDDNPVSGRPTDYTLSFTDDSGRFRLANCDCRITFAAGGRTVATRPLSVASDEVSENRYTFPQPAVYTLQVQGTPKTPGAFQPFTLTYEVRVTGGQAHVQTMPVLLWVGMGMAIGLILLAGYAMNGETTGEERTS